MKTNTNELRKEVRTLLLSKADRVHYLNFPKPAIYPYAVFDLRENGESEGRRAYQLDIDICDKDRKTVINIADGIEELLDHKVVSTAKVFFHCYNAQRYNVVEEDKSIERVHISCELYFYSKEE